MRRRLAWFGMSLLLSCACVVPLRGLLADESSDNEKKEGFVSIFNGKDFDGWAGPVDNYEVTDGVISCKAGKGGTIFTKEEYSDFIVRLDFKVPAGANNGSLTASASGGTPQYSYKWSNGATTARGRDRRVGGREGVRRAARRAATPCSSEGGDDAGARGAAR